MKESLRLIFVLGIVSIFSGMVLAQTYIATGPRINMAAEERLREAIFELLPQAKEYKLVEGAEIEMYEGYDENGSPAGVVFVSETGGFQGTIRIMASLDINKKVLMGMTVLSHTETPGLGSRISESFFTGQFEGKSIFDEFSAKRDVDIITGATISTEAAAHGLKKGIEKVLEFYDNGGEIG